MTDREFKKLKRPELVEIIYQLQKSLAQEQAEKEELQRQLGEKHLNIEKAESIAEAVIKINCLMETAQRTANQYLEQIQMDRDEARRILETARNEAKALSSEEPESPQTATL